MFVESPGKGFSVLSKAHCLFSDPRFSLRKSSASFTCSGTSSVSGAGLDSKTDGGQWPLCSGSSRGNK